MASWDHSHADGASDGFVAVHTLPAERPLQFVIDIGTFQPLVGPVVAADGTVYLGNDQGEVIAPDAGGVQKWRKNIGDGLVVVASPVLGADGAAAASEDHIFVSTNSAFLTYDSATLQRSAKSSGPAEGSPAQRSVPGGTSTR